MIQPAATPPPPVVVYGAGGHGRVVAEAAQAAGLVVLGFLDDALPEGASAGTAGRVLDRQDERLDHARFIVAIGNNTQRLRHTRRLQEEGRDLCKVIHPTAWVSPSASLGEGVFIGPHALIQSDAVLHDAVIVNSGAVAEHDCVLSEAVHLAPAAVLGGRVQVGARAILGLGSRVLPGVQVGVGVTLGAGAVLTRDAAPGLTLSGVPARPHQSL